MAIFFSRVTYINYSFDMNAIGYSHHSTCLLCSSHNRRNYWNIVENPIILYCQQKEQLLNLDKFYYCIQNVGHVFTGLYYCVKSWGKELVVLTNILNWYTFCKNLILKTENLCCCLTIVTKLNWYFCIYVYVCARVHF